ncbi:protein ROLLING AND ERECT LEAF 2 [Lycium barbarum]|uniref:protein ROLLING AND ERECT LEAF 2 n=1 Tax=Lycium barbarum TaxID=112863 RepID=UPI00293EC94F|nr:protein ROLLING AND ERECT LEAF 2 [Lycium barbarum]XP_060170024.1 protein ROLLING AND ERECT LEAF 2 [Lycium barbarum]XP_060170025.1 protein ROLLING AND ERECT LEAF 2 [Lycium barbarum]XP_060170026.1 protein ROLLING AND ERECT LEAF 2 [Lycium barbarum]XP_060170027.1 protein ROLLING AND ERECT LEAF 2 [Lycium barbarum]
MGASNSKLEEDKALQLCRERKKFVRQALDGRCNLAATHIAYIESLKITGTALRRFAEPEAPIESSIYTSTSATPEPLGLTEKSLSQFSFSSRSVSRNVDATENILPSPSPPSSSRYHVNHMKFRGTFSRKVEEKPPVPVTVSVTSSTPQNSTPRSTERPEASPFETPPFPSETSPFEIPPSPTETSPWDYFGLGHDIDNHLTSRDGRVENRNDTGHHRDEDRVPASEDEEEHYSSPGRDGSQVSDDEFDDEPSTETLVRSFQNVNRTTDHASNGGSPDITSARNVVSEAKFLNGEKSKSPDLSPLRAAPTGPADDNNGMNSDNNGMKTPVKENDIENKIAPKDFFFSIKDIEYLFIKASESGREVPRMLEANKFHFRPIFPGRESGSMTRILMKSCFSCGDDPSQIPEEPPQNSVKYLTWHRTTSSHASSPTRLGVHSADDIEDVTNNLFDSFCMVSGSHASTLDRLFAWEKKLYDEVKASEMIRSHYDAKRKLLRQLESKVEKPQRIDKTRAVVKDLHSRIGVAIHRINDISRKIEEIRDKELQPQLEELIEGLRKMWEVMLDCHKRQLHIISIAHSPGNMKILIQSDFRRQIAMHLEHELSSLASSFMKWIVSQKAYVEAINKWLHKSVHLREKSSRRKRKPQPVPLRNHGPPIYTTCSVWLDMLDSLPTKEVSDAMKDLAAEISHFVPRQEKHHGKGGNRWQSGANDDPGLKIPLRDDSLEDWITGFNNFRTSLAFFLGQLNNFSESSLKMFTNLQKAIQEAKHGHALRMNSQS